MSFVPKARFDRFRSRDEWDDECTCSGGWLVAIVATCAPVALKHWLDHRAEQRRIAHAQANPHLYGIDEDDDE